MATEVERVSGQAFHVKEMSNGSISQPPRTQRHLEKKYRIPDFQHPYTKHPRHHLTAQYTVEAHEFLVSHGVDKQLGPKLWPAFVSAKTPELIAFTFFDTEPRDFLLLCKFGGLVFALDTILDESEYADNPDKSCSTLLGMTLALLWNYPEDQRFLEHVQPLYDCITTDESRLLVEAFHEDIVRARNMTKKLMDIEMTPLASAFRELWMEYCEAVPAEFALREARSVQDYLMGCVSEAINRKSAHEITNLQHYIALRRLSAGVLPFIICSDLLVARSLKVPQIPNHLFYGPEMQNLLLAISDIIGWHNDILSFHKEVILAEDGHNLVKVACEERNCNSYTEAGEIALRLMQDRIDDMERAYEQLKAVASPTYHPAIDRYMKSCRDWVSGTHQWHLISTRYNIATTSM